MKIQDKEISHRIYSSEFKPIRTEKDLHLGEHTLMRNTTTRRRVVVKIHECSSIDELHIILKDYENLNNMHMQTSNLCDFVGYYLEEIKDPRSMAAVHISLIYDYHQATLQQQINTMMLKNQTFQQKELECFLSCSLKALATLQKYGLNFLNLKYSNVLVQSRNTIDMVYRLFYTPYLNGSVSEIKQNRSNIDDYNLSEHQLKLINSANNFSSQNSETSLDFNDRLRIDKQALGLMLLRMATLSQKHGIYTINDKNDLVWDVKGIQSRLQIMNKNYSKQFTKKVQYLLTSREFWGFQNLPQFMLNSQMMNMSRVQRSADKSLFRNSRNKSPTINSNKKYLDISASKISQGQRESRISVNNPLSTSSIARLKGQSLQNSKCSHHSPSQFSTQSPTKTKTARYSELKHQLQEQAKKHLQQPFQDPVQYEDGSSYIGSVKRDRKNGYGICYYKEGDIYAGQWKNDLISGKGIYLFYNCDLYKGEVKEGFKQGMGKYVYANGNYYEGEWKADKKHGFGVFQNVEKGEKYEGNWNNGVRQGSGTYTWKNGDKYQGGFSQGLKSGNGIITKNNNIKLTGQFYNDGIHGIVCIKYPSGTIYTGQIKTNPYQNKIILQGKSKQINLLTQTNYEGNYINNNRNGNCKICYKNGDIYEGFIKDNLFEGMGKYYYEYLQCWYSGGWKQGRQHGHAKLEFVNGTVIECDWVEGRPSDKGKILYKNGDRYQGQIGRLGRNGKGTYYTAKGDKVQGIFRNGILIHKKS